MALTETQVEDKIESSGRSQKYSNKNRYSDS